MLCSSRLTLLRIAAVILAAGMLAGCKTKLYGNLPERDANEMIMVLSEKGVQAERLDDKEGTFGVEVDGSAIGSASEILRAHGLPHQKFETLGSVFQNNQMVTSPFEERARFMYAISQELSKSISQIPGVVDARVHVVLPESSPLSLKTQRPRASVFIYHLPHTDLSSQVAIIKMQIVNAIEGLNYEDVSIALYPNSQIIDNARFGRAGELGSSLISLLLFLGAAVALYFTARTWLRPKTQ